MAEPTGEMIGELHTLLQSIGDDTAAMLKQMRKGKWIDEHENPVSLNIAMIAMLKTMKDIMAFRHKHLNYTKPEYPDRQKTAGVDKPG